VNRKRLGLIALGMVAVGAGYACFSDLEGTVRFNAGVPDFGTPPPPIEIGAWEERVNRPIPTANGPAISYLEEERIAKEKELRISRNRAKANVLERNGDLKGAAAALLELIADNPENREALRDRAEVLRAAADQPSLPVRDYFAARERKDVPALTRMASDAAMGALRAHARYALASIAYDQSKFADAATHYEQAAQLGGPRREPALMMAARSLLRSPAQQDPYEWTDKPLPAAAPTKRAERLLATLRAEFPESRFAVSAKGWQARANYVQGDRLAALAGYLQQLASSRDWSDQVNALSSIRLVFNQLTKDEATMVRPMIERDPSLLQPYLDYRLYHTAAKPADLRSLATFAQAILAKNPAARIAGATHSRLAEIAYLTGDIAGARREAERALEDSANPRADLATYVLAGATAKQGRPADAAKTLEGYETRFSESYLAKPARELRALSREQSGDRVGAFAEYDALGYEYDIAYLLDARMTPAELQRVAEAGPLSRRDLARFSLGMRHLRREELDKAIAIFEPMSATRRKQLAKAGSRDYSWIEAPKNSPLDRMGDPLQTARDLKRLKAAATTPEGKYALASYYYNRRNLLLYNPVWQGARGVALGWFWNRDIAKKDDEVARAQNHYEVESLFHARALCLEIAKAHPRSPVAPKALYRAATSTRRLANFNPWWRNHAEQQDYYAQAANLLKRVYTEYPKDPLAKNARKYEKVYRREGQGRRAQTMFEEQ